MKQAARLFAALALALAYSHAIARVEFDYDANGARTATRTYNASNTQLYTESTPRDERGRIDYKDAHGVRLDYDYYANGLLKDTVSSNSDGVNLGYRYDELNRLAYVDDGSGIASGTTVRTTDYTYNPNGSLETLTQPNAVVHTYGYDSLNRLRTLNVAQSGGLGVTLHAYEYKLKPSGHRWKVIEDAKTTKYEYDDIYRLTSETVAGSADPGQNGLATYDLDKVGNRKSRTSSVPSVPSSSNTFNARDWLSGDAYDANGNTVQGGTGVSPVGSTTDTYDFENRLILRQKSDGTKVNVAYDADGIRIQKTLFDTAGSLAATTSYLVDTNNLTGYAQVVEERTTAASGTTTKVYTYGSGLISQSVSQSSGSSTLAFFSFDGHGSVRELTDATGAVTDRYDYDAFGVIVFRSGASTNSYLYCGEQWDSDLGLYYNRARYLNPDSGRFWSMDNYEGNSSDPISLHKYLYGNADPVGRFDPTGHDATLLSLSMTQWAVATIGAIAVVTVYKYSQAIQTGGEGLDNPLGRALAGLSTGIASTLIFASESVREQIAKAEIALAATATAVRRSIPKIVPVSMSITPKIAMNVAARQGGKPQRLTRCGFIQRNINRANALRGRGPAGPGLSWDEYPFASTEEGGMGASVVPVPQMENWKQGGIVGASYLLEDIQVGDPFWAVVIP